MENSFIHAYEDYRKPLLRYSSFKLKNNAISEDLVQTTFLKTWQYLSKNKKINSMRSFLYRVLNNLIVDQYRKKEPICFDLLENNELTMRTDDPEIILDKMDGKIAATFIRRLSKQYRKVISMRFLKEMQIDEIATATHQSKNTVTVQICRGVKKLAMLFKRNPIKK